MAKKTYKFKMWNGWKLVTSYYTIVTSFVPSKPHHQ